MELSKLKAFIGKKGEVIDDTIFKRYRNRLEDSFITKQARLRQSQSDLDEREQLIQEREKNLAKYYLIPKLYINSIILLAVAVLILIAYVQQDFAIQEDSRTITQTDNESVEAEENISVDSGSCIRRGIQYYKDIGSYPTLSTGESAKLHIAKACVNSKGMVFR